MSDKQSEIFLSRQEEMKWLSIFAHRVKILIPARATGGVFSLIEQQSPAGQGMPTHVHTKEDETFIVLEGELDLEYDGMKIKARAGDSIFLPRNKAHGYINNSKTPSRILVIITPAGFEQFFLDVQSVDSTNSSNFGSVADLLKRKYATTFI